MVENFVKTVGIEKQFKTKKIFKQYIFKIECRALLEHIKFKTYYGLQFFPLYIFWINLWPQSIRIDQPKRFFFNWIISFPFRSECLLNLPVVDPALSFVQAELVVLQCHIRISQFYNHSFLQGVSSKWFLLSIYIINAY